MMPVCAFGGSQVWRGLRCTFGVSIVVGFVFLSGCRGETSAKEPVTCPPETNFLPVWPLEGIPFFFKCPEGSSLFPTASDGNFKTFCRNSSCTNQAELGTAYTLREAEAGDDRVVPVSAGAQTKVYELVVLTQPEFPTTLYFLCKSTQDRATESLATTEARSTSDTMESTCTFQVAVFSRKPLSDAASEKVCEFGNTMKEVTLNPKSNKVTFRCGDKGFVWPLNFENAFEGEACTEEVSLASLGLAAFRVEGESSDETAKGPAYALEVSEFPAGSSRVRLCYKCKRLSQVDRPAALSSADECTIRINVEPKSQTEGDNEEDGQMDGKPPAGDASDLPKHNIVCVGVLLLSSVLALSQAV
ncbi:SRS domain-containing protein [Neospora caninum Liverpool]|uniref:SRS domain-containing protein n=1 Tax=Neospora caninum (strain Liverpool) TaxID=572307 RepID=F0VLA5_NEOCL|nr:SRS domain-containing protein [Neospora caninum Liverpool]CBZ54857.1 SRS domain-containing protein [Neospora caninum Liverpool]CEL69577.1 TPA: SRS domain-containing protein [Neospora caninum Liverpool]|eukprot:XP_003884885.1 SRS domain-containing protein [Neospora caninum Liverpool]